MPYSRLGKRFESGLQTASLLIRGIETLAFGEVRDVVEVAGDAGGEGSGGVGGRGGGIIEDKAEVGF